MPTSSQQLERARARAASPVRPLCRISTSLTCRSIVCSGLSEVIGSWKIIDDAVAAHRQQLALRRADQLLALEADACRRDGAPCG